MVTFVILHYNDKEMTNECIEMLLQLNRIEDVKIVVVDNASMNGSGIFLKQQYANDERISVILNSRNLGFAKGNNIGYYYAKSHFPSSYIIVMNNDVLVEQKDFIDRLVQDRYCQDYEIIMPDIINKNGQHQNPFRVNKLTDKEIIKNYLRIIILLAIYHIPVVNKIWFRRSEKKKIFSTKEEKAVNNNEMMIPHGACIIYTKKWIEQEDIAFVPDTFLYGEEDILYEYIINRNYRTLFLKELQVKHLEDVSTNSIADTDIKKAKFLFKNSFASQKVFLRLRNVNNSGKKYIISGADK